MRKPWCFFWFALPKVIRGAGINQLHQLQSSFFGVPGINATYDYVIVGGGTAGLTLATRLAAASYSVAVVEAGGFYEQDNGNRSVVPNYGIQSASFFQPLIDWGIVTSPQPGLADRTPRLPRGKTLGGSSARNFMLYHRPSAGALDKWASVVDDDSYRWENMLPYYKKSVKYTPAPSGLYSNATNVQDPSAFEEGSGPLEVSFSNFLDPFSTWMQKAFIKAGLSLLPGLNNGKIIGSAYGTMTIEPKTATRSSSEASFLQQALSLNKAPTVYKNTLGTRIVFDKQKKATGVLTLTQGSYGTPSVNFTLNASREVIISAGVVQSPQLLLVSGVGDCDELATKFNLPCVSHLPGVGKNLWDHIQFCAIHRVQVQTASAFLNNPVLAEQAVFRYLTNASGPLSISISGYYAWEKLPEMYRSRLSNETITRLDSTFPADWPDLEWLPTASFRGDPGDPVDGHNYATLCAGIMSPFSRGSVSLAGPDMVTAPIVDPQWLTAKEDKEIAIQAFHRLRDLWDMLAELGVASREEFLPGPGIQTDDQIMRYISSVASTVSHPSCTCKMGRRNDSMAVLDNRARVYGVQNLRVVDASSFPFLPPGHPQATVYAFAEKIADEIINSHYLSEV